MAEALIDTELPSDHASEWNDLSEDDGASSAHEDIDPHLRILMLRQARGFERRRITESIKTATKYLRLKCDDVNRQRVSAQREIILNYLDSCLKVHEEIVKLPGFVANSTDNFEDTQSKVEQIVAKIDKYLATQLDARPLAEKESACSRSHILSEDDARNAVQAVDITHLVSRRHETTLDTQGLPPSKTKPLDEVQRLVLHQSAQQKQLEAVVHKTQQSVNEQTALLNLLLERFKVMESTSGRANSEHPTTYWNVNASPWNELHRYERQGARPKQFAPPPFKSEFHVVGSPDVSETRMPKDNPIGKYSSARALMRSPTSVENETRQTSKLFRLPKLELTPFDGDPIKWHDFALTFSSLVDNNSNLSKTDKMAYLRHCLAPNVRKLLGDCLNNPVLYDDAIEQLEQLFGHPHVLADSYIRTITSLPALKTARDYKSLLDFSTTLRGAVASLRTLECKTELESSSLLTLLIDKLPDDMKSKWGKRIVKAYPARLTLEDFDNWLYTCVKAEMVVKHPLFVSASNDRKYGKKPEVSKQARPSVYTCATPINSTANNYSDPNASTEAESETKKDNKRPCPLCKEPHPLDLCNRFNNFTLEQRADKVRELKCCLKCLRGGHKSRECHQKRRCQTCKQGHHTLLHGAPKIFPKVSSDGPADIISVPIATVGTNHLDDSDNTVLLAVVPVSLSSGDKSVDTYALIDSGAETTLITNRVADELGIKGPKRSYRIGTFHGDDPSFPSCRVNFMLSAVKSPSKFKVSSAYTVPNIHLSHKKFDWPTIKLNWQHLKELDLPAVDFSQVNVLIGRNVRDAHDILDQRKATSSIGPDAILTPFGWCIAGPLPTALHVCHAPRVNLLSNVDANLELQENITRLWEDDKIPGSKSILPRLSEEEEKGLKMLQNTIRHTGDRWEVGLMWRDDSVILPNNWEHALRQFMWQEQKLMRDPKLAERYHTGMMEYINMKYAVPVDPTDAGTPGRVWHIPHHAVVNPRKPEKIRIVFNCSALFKGTSLNKSLLQGPDLLVNAIGVMLRFRQFKFAAVADIKGMYHQVAVPKRDQSALRFLYRKPGSNETISTYQMTRHVFGAVSSPTSCIFALHKTADRFGCDLPEAAEVLKKNTYVDNCHFSHDNEDVLCSLAHQTKILCSRGGFHLCQFMANSRKLLPQFEIQDLSGKLDPTSANLPAEPALGLLLDWELDSFIFKFNDSASSQIPSMRKVLSCLASIYDPLGFLAVITVTARILFQDCWRAQLSWDDDLPPRLREKWTTWYQDLRQLQHLKIARCIRVRANPLMISLHVLCDASENAYGAAVYCRAVHLDGSVTVRLIIGKAKVSPIRQLSIPRLELKGAVEGARLAAAVRNELGLCEEISVTYWLDSITVLRWIHAKTAKYHAFVAHRITEILELSSPSQWRYIPGTLNPADDASRGVRISSFSSSHRWLTGPPFLCHHSSAWPATPGLPEPPDSDPEVAPPRWAGLISNNSSNKLFDYSRRAPSWDRYVHVIGWLNRFHHNSAKRTKNPKTDAHSQHSKKQFDRYLSVTELRQAKTIALRLDQRFYFDGELSDLLKGRTLSSTSKLNQLTPFIDENGILRVRGRIDKGAFSEFLKCPTILHHQSPLARLLIIEAHQNIQHAKVEQTIAALRAEYYILRFRRTVKQVLSTCPVCRVESVQPHVPLMAALPANRLKSHLPPFTITGIDYFGPYEVSILRRRVLRYGVLFTCMTTRAVHIEMAHALDTESFLLAFWRFANRRGCPDTCYSDNGTNLTSGQKNLNEALRSLDTRAVADRLARKRITWHFNPPAAPHFGGVWERLVKSAKQALKHVLNGRHLTDDVLQSAFVSVENLLNSRPLTHVAVDPHEPEPLTPHHFLIGRANTNPLPDHQSSRSCPSLKSWRHAQDIASHFWRRWLTEYIPNLIERRKWLQHRRNLAVGDFVLIVDPASPRGKWPAGKVIRVHPGDDGVVRSARVKTRTGEYERPVAKLCLLEYASDEDVSPKTGPAM